MCCAFQHVEVLAVKLSLCIQNLCSFLPFYHIEFTSPKSEGPGWVSSSSYLSLFDGHFSPSRTAIAAGRSLWLRKISATRGPRSDKVAQAGTSGSLAMSVADVRCESGVEAMPSDAKLLFIYLFKAMAQEKSRRGCKKTKQSLLYSCHLAGLLTAWGWGHESHLLFLAEKKNKTKKKSPLWGKWRHVLGRMLVNMALPQSRLISNF